jgi:hypothetical protein
MAESIMTSEIDAALIARVMPHLTVLEEARRHHWLRLRRRAAAFGALTLAWLAAAVWIGHPLLWAAAPALAAVGVFIGLQLRGRPGRDYAEALRAIVLPPLRELAGGWRHERVAGRDVFSRGDARLEPSWPLFALPDWRTPIPPLVLADIDRLRASLATAAAPAYPAATRESEREARVTS